MDNREIQRRLNDNGFPCGPVDGVIGRGTKEAIRRFQVAYCGPGGWLDLDGIAGPRTQEALHFLPRLSTHFTWREVACKHCNKAYVRRELLSALEVLREHIVRGPIKLLSVYRCDEHNAHVGGKSQSMHRFGAAADLSTYVSFEQARNARRFSGIGTRERGRRASHVDVRGHGGLPNYTPGRTADSPEVWAY